MDNVYQVRTDAAEIIAGTSNRVLPVFTEATKVVAADNIQRSLSYLKSFANSIDKAAKERGRDLTIAATAGNIKQLKQYDFMLAAMEHLTSFLGTNNAELNALKGIDAALLKFQGIYSDGYRLGIPLIIYEYEAALSTLIRGISVLIVTQVDPQISGIGTIRFNKIRRQSGGIFTKVAKDIARELKSLNHENYLKQLVELATDPELKLADETVVTESVDAVVGLTKTIVNVFRYGLSAGKTVNKFVKLVVRSMFGIVPLIRTVVYMHYKKKADTIENLELQAHYIQLNIQQLENKKTMDEDAKNEIIRKQLAFVEAYKKKAEKLRAQLMDTERDGAKALAADDANITPSDDYVLD